MTNTTPDDATPLARIDAAISALAAINDDATLAIRDAIINDPDSPSAIRALAADYDMRAIDILPILGMILDLSDDDFSYLCLSFSICPIHRHDRAICFDEPAEFPQCAAINSAFPSHDT